MAQGDEEITSNPIYIKHLPAKMGQKEITPAQGSFDLKVDCQKEVQGIGMGVLSDGTPFLTQRGLARLCGVQNAHIGTISSEWNDSPVKPRIAAIRDLLAKRGEHVDLPHMQITDGGIVFAYPDFVCVAILEYYAFEAGPNCKNEALSNFRLLAGKALQDFIYTQVGYDPSGSAVPDVWRQFHDRVSLTYNAMPAGYFGVFKEIADMIVTLGQAGLHIDAAFVPDISVGKAWSLHWEAANLEAAHGFRRKFEHNYPSYFPQAVSNPQTPWCYPESALGEFRRWFREIYIGQGKFSTYITGKASQKQLPASFAQLAIAAYSA